MNNRKKGFTLVELLAVVTVIGVIITLASTAVVEITNRGKKRAEKLTAKNYIMSVNDYNKISDADKKLKATSSKNPCEDVSGNPGKIKCDISKVSPIIKESISGKLPKSGVIYIDTSTYEVYYASIKVKKYLVEFQNGKYNIISESSSND